MVAEGGLFFLYHMFIVAVGFIMAYYIMYIGSLIYNKIKNYLHKPTESEEIHKLLEVSRDVDKRIILIETEFEKLVNRLEEVEDTLKTLETKKKHSK